jgi:RNA polymerase sigma factor (sigma-70 family)
MPKPSALCDDPRERDYRAYRQDVLAMLRAQFPGVPDHEEIYQEAWAEALEREARGGDLTEPGPLLMTIAWRRARDRLRRRRAETLDPASPVFANQVDVGSALDEEVQARIDSAVVRDIVEALQPEHAAVIKLRHENQYTSREIQHALGMKAKRLEHVVSEAYKLVEQALAAPNGTETPWRRRQRSLLLACEVGLATAGQRRRAHRIVREDPVCRAMLRDIRATLDHVAALVPVPVLIDERPRRWALLRIDLNDRLAAVRDGLADIAGRHSNSLEQAGAGGLAGLGGGAALKVAVVCLAVGGGTVVCIDSGLLDRPDRRAPARHARVHHRPSKPAEPRPLAEHRPAPLPQPKLKRTTHHTTKTTTTAQVSTNASAPPPPSPAPRGSTEFGPGAVGSQAASNQPAAGPGGGGGEFGP